MGPTWALGAMMGEPKRASLCLDGRCYMFTTRSTEYVACRHKCRLASHQAKDLAKWQAGKEAFDTIGLAGLPK